MGDSWPRVFAAKSLSDNVRRASSSGGLYHELASVVISRGGVVYACRSDENLHVSHVRCVTMDECERCRGSKYVQSDMGSAIKELRSDLRSGRQVLFTGTPCQVDAVRKNCAAQGDLLTADIICHGVPSPGVFSEWLHVAEGIRKKHVVRYEWRPKNRGWRHLERVVWDDGTSEQDTHISDAWRYLFYNNKMLRPSCYRCPYTSTVRSSDLTIADFWGIENSSASGMNDELGVSLVLASTERGLRLFEEASLERYEVTLAEALPGNPMLVRPSTCEGERADVWKELYQNGLEHMMKQERYLVSPVRHALGSVKRRLAGGA